MNKHVASALKLRILLRVMTSHELQEESIITMYCKVVGTLSKTYAPDDVIEESKADIMEFAHAPKKTSIEFAKLLLGKSPLLTSSARRLSTKEQLYRKSPRLHLP